MKAKETLKQKEEERRQKEQAFDFIKAMVGRGDSAAESALQFLKSRGLGTDAYNLAETEENPGDEGREGNTIQIGTCRCSRPVFILFDVVKLTQLSF